MFKTRLKGEQFKLKSKTKKWWDKNISDNVDHNLELLRDGNRWFLCIPVRPKEKPVTIKQPLVALDPGVRTFQTFYSESSVGKIGDGLNKKFLSEREDKLKSLKKSMK